VANRIGRVARWTRWQTIVPQRTHGECPETTGKRLNMCLLNKTVNVCMYFKIEKVWLKIGCPQVMRA
jgi:hypothetical protein